MIDYFYISLLLPTYIIARFDIRWGIIYLIVNIFAIRQLKISGKESVFLSISHALIFFLSELKNEKIWLIPISFIPLNSAFLIEFPKSLFISLMASSFSHIIHHDFVFSLITSLQSILLLRIKAKMRSNFVGETIKYSFFIMILSAIINPNIKPILFFVSSIISGIISLGTIVILEKFLDRLTPFSLIELQNLDNEILKSLRRKAPGTFYHSLIVGDIAYQAAEEVSADAELVRCAALYHDIGKSLNPEFFVENLDKGYSEKHLKINPGLSSKVLVSHVTEGEKIAISYRLPKRIIDFIKEHHGTTEPEYFVALSEEMKDKIDMRYPGPEPRSIETAILMIADSAEAAVRSIDEYTPEKIDRIVEKIVEDKIKKRQFDNCPITLVQLTKIKESIKKSLKEFYHRRISYDREKIKEEAERREKEREKTKIKVDGKEKEEI